MKNNEIANELDIPISNIISLKICKENNRFSANISYSKIFDLMNDEIFIDLRNAIYSNIRHE